MNKFISLLRVSILGLVRGKDTKKRKLSHSVILLLIGALICYYSFTIANTMLKGLRLISSEHILLPIFYSFTSIFLVLTNYKKINGLFFKSKDYDLLEAMPIKREYIILSKMVELSLSALAITLVFMVPPYIVYISKVTTTLSFHILYFVSLIFIPCVPVIISAIVGYLISYISSFFKRKELVQLIASLFIMMFAFYIGYNSGSGNTEQLANVGKTILSFFNKYYPLTIFYKETVIDGNFLSLTIYIIINIIAFALLILLISKTYNYINGKLSEVHHNKNQKFKRIGKTSVRTTLLKKDYKKLISSTNYLLNTCFGLALLTIFVISMFVSKSGLFGMLNEVGGFNAKYIPAYIMLMFVGYIYPLCISMSLEGKSFYLLRVLPIKFKDIVKEKLLFQLILSLPTAIISMCCLGFKLHFDLPSFLLFLSLYIIVCLFLATTHLLVDIIFLKLDWENELKIIKRSLQSFISATLAMVVSLVPLCAVFNTKTKLSIYIGVFVILFITSLIILTKYGTKKFESTIN